MRYQINDYFDDDGGNRRHVREFVILKGTPAADFPKFIGLGVLEVQHGNHVIPQQFSANLQADTLDEAFENFDPIMSQAAEMTKQKINEQIRAEASKIVVPG